MGQTLEIKLSETQKVDCPIVVGTEGEKAIDVAQLRAKTGLVTLDPAFMNTASTKSAITFLDGEKGAPALPRHSDRGAGGKKEQLRRG